MMTFTPLRSTAIDSFPTGLLSHWTSTFVVLRGKAPPCAGLCSPPPHDVGQALLYEEFNFYESH